MECYSRMSGEFCRLITELRSHGLISASSLMIGNGSTGHRKLKNMISKNPDFSSSVVSFFDHVVILPLRSLTATKLDNEKLRSDLKAIQTAVLCFEKEKATEFRAEGELLAVARPNTEKLRSAYKQQLMLLEKLSRSKDKLGKSLRWTKKWRKAWNAIYTMLDMGVSVGSVGLAAFMAAPAATVPTTVAANSINSMKPWFQSLWDEHEITLEAEMVVVAAMDQKGRYLAHEFMSILSLMEMVEIDVEAMPGKEEEIVEAVAALGIGNIKNKIGLIENRMDGLDEKVDWCISEIRKVAADFLEIITEELI